MSIQSNPVEKDWKKPRYSLTTNLWYDEAMPKLPQWTKKDLHDFIVANPREGEQFAWLSWRNRIKVSCLSLAVTVTRCATRKKKTTRATCDFFFFFFFFFFFQLCVCNRCTRLLRPVRLLLLLAWFVSAILRMPLWDLRLVVSGCCFYVIASARC
jgi:hypothetical protein